MVFTVTDAERQELLVTYAALILNDEKLTVSADNITKLVKAAGATVEPYWPKLFASLLEGQDVNALLLSSGGSAAAAPAAGGAAAPAAGGAAPAKEAEKEKEKSEESDNDMGFSLFD